MNRSTATADALTVASSRASDAATVRHHGRADSTATRAARDLPREYRISHVFRTLGRGLVVEYEPA